MNALSKSIALVAASECVACGCCVKVCPRQAISIWKGVHAVIDSGLCVGCGRCVKECPACVISLIPRLSAGHSEGHSAGNSDTGRKMP